MVRRFRAEPVSEEILGRILSTVRHVPTAGFSQGIDVVVLESPDQLEHFWRTTTPPDEWPPDERPSKGAAHDLPRHLPPVIILPFSDKRAYLRRYAKADKAGFGMEVEEGWPIPYWDIDAAMAVMTILLAAVDEGLGGWFFGIFQGEDQLVRDLGVPDGPRLLGAIGIGYPDPDEPPFSRDHRQPDEYVHRGRW